MNTNFDYEKYLYTFLDSIEVRKTSKSTYERQLKLFMRWLQKKNIVEPNSETIVSYLNYLKNTKKLADFTICGYLTAIKLFFSWLEATKKYSNIAKNIKGPKKNKIKRAFSMAILEHDKIEKLLKNIDRSTLDGKRDYALIRLISGAGLRVIEIQRAKKGDLVHCCDFTVLWVQGKGKDFKNERVSLANKISVPIYDYFKARSSVSDAEPLFASHSRKNFGQPITTRSISRIVKNRLKNVGVDGKRIDTNSLRYATRRP